MTNPVGTEEARPWWERLTNADEARERLSSLQAELSRCREERDNLNRHNDKLHRRLEEHLGSDYDALKGEVRKAWEKVKARERSDAELRKTIANLEGKVERQSDRITRSEAQRDALEKVALTTSALHWENERLKAALGAVERELRERGDGRISKATERDVNDALSQEGTK